MRALAGIRNAQTTEEGEEKRDLIVIMKSYMWKRFRELQNFFLVCGLKGIKFCENFSFGSLALDLFESIKVSSFVLCRSEAQLMTLFTQ